MYLINLDSEQAMILVASLEAADKILAARLHRVDPNKILSDSVRMGQIKLENIRAQMESGSIAQWEDLTPVQKRKFHAFIKEWQPGVDPLVYDALYSAITNTVLSSRTGSLPLINEPRRPA